MKTKIVLLGIVFLGFLLRFINVGSIPAILNRDEAALAYNAYLLKETGKDEWGKTWPLALESFGDYKLPGYPFFLLGSFSLFGYNDFAVRLPSVLAGTGLIALSYFFAREFLAEKEKEKKTAYKNEKLGLLFALMIALQPIFFFYSRIAFEANLALLFFLAGVFLLWQDTSLLRIRIQKDILASIFFLLAVFTYNTPLLLLPFLFPLVLYWRGWKKMKSWLPAVGGMAIVLILGGASLLSLSKQKSGITIFSDESIWKQSVDYHNQFSGVSQKILGNKVVFFGRIILQNYLNTFSPQFLVIKGGAHPWHELPGFGHFYWITYFLSMLGILIAIISILKILRKENRQEKEKIEIKKNFSLLYLLFISPLPAVVTVDAPHATRSLFFFVIFCFLAIMGVQKILEKISSIKNVRVSSTFLKNLFLSAIIIVTLVESGRYFFIYFSSYPSESNKILKGGFQKFIQQQEAKYSTEKVAVIDDAGYQYILTAWYLKMPPQEFFATVQKHLPDRIGFRYGYKLGRYRFIVSPNDRVEDEKTYLEWNPQIAQWEEKK
jgi:4-amino-4-deoxy-L-arabinose transferase-like glycosyltransferase